MLNMELLNVSFLNFVNELQCHTDKLERETLHTISYDHGYFFAYLS